MGSWQLTQHSGIGGAVAQEAACKDALAIGRIPGNPARLQRQPFLLPDR